VGRLGIWVEKNRTSDFFFFFRGAHLFDLDTDHLRLWETVFLSVLIVLL